MREEKDKNLSRREFIARLLKSGISVAATGGICYWLYDGVGPQVDGENREIVTIPDFSVPKRNGQTMCVVTCSERINAVRKAIDMLGGIERFIKPGEIVLIKPNVAFATPAKLGATTNPELLAEVVRLCYDQGRAKQVIVTDNPINDPASCFSLSGIGKAASLAGAKVMLPKEYYFKPTTLKSGKLINNWPVLFEPFTNVNKVIGIAPVKDHHRSGASMTIKNWYGLLGGRRNIFHQDINTIIAELAIMVKPTLVILDGIEVMVSNGPTGGSLTDLQRKNTLIASCDQVAADSYGASLLGLKVSDLPYLAKAELAGAGTTDYELLKPLIGEVSV